MRMSADWKKAFFNPDVAAGEKQDFNPPGCDKLSISPGWWKFKKMTFSGRINKRIVHSSSGMQLLGRTAGLGGTLTPAWGLIIAL